MAVFLSAVGVAGKELSERVSGSEANNYRVLDKFPYNQTSNSGNLTRLGWRDALMNGKEMSPKSPEQESFTYCSDY